MHVDPLLWSGSFTAESRLAPSCWIRICTQPAPGAHLLTWFQPSNQLWHRHRHPGASNNAVEPQKIIAQNLVICREPSNLGLKSNWAIITLYVTLERWNIFSAAAELQLEKHHLAGPPQSIDIDWFKTELRQNLQDHELYRDNMSKIKGPFVWDKFHRKPSVIRGFNRTVIPKKIPKDPNMKILKLCIDR